MLDRILLCKWLTHSLGCIWIWSLNFYQYMQVNVVFLKNWYEWIKKKKWGNCRPQNTAICRNTQLTEKAVFMHRQKIYTSTSHRICRIITKLESQKFASSNQKGENKKKRKILSEGILNLFQSSPFSFRDPECNKYHSKGTQYHINGEGSCQ